MQGKRSSLGRGVVKWREEEEGGGEGCGKETLACEANTRREREGVSRKCNSELNKNWGQLVSPVCCQMHFTDLLNHNHQSHRERNINVKWKMQNSGMNLHKEASKASMSVKM